VTAKQFRTALTALRPAARFSYDGDGSALGMHAGSKGERYAGLRWIGPGEPPTLAEIEAKHQELNATLVDGDVVTRLRLQQDLKTLLHEIDATDSSPLARAVVLIGQLQLL
jgi:hypothetical protein